MKIRIWVCLALVASGIGLMLSLSVAIAQQAPVSPPPSEVTPPQSPPEAPRTGEVPATSVNPETNVPIAAEARPISWGSLLFGLFVGVGIGYLIGRQQSGSPEIRRDHAA